MDGERSSLSIQIGCMSRSRLTASLASAAFFALGFVDIAFVLLDIPYWSVSDSPTSATSKLFMSLNSRKSDRHVDPINTGVSFQASHLLYYSHTPTATSYSAQWLHLKVMAYHLDLRQAFQPASLE